MSKKITTCDDFIKDIERNAEECVKIIIKKTASLIRGDAHFAILNAYLIGIALKIIDVTFHFSFTKGGESDLMSLKDTIIEAINEKINETKGRKK